MSLAPISGRIGAAPAPGPDHPSSLALVFLLDAAYLDAFRVFCLSLASTGSFAADPIIALSPDRDVLADPFVARICDLTIHIGEPEIARFSKIRTRLIETRHRLPWIAKFTFLKWLAYRNFGFDWHLMLDADMLALKNLEPFAAMRGDSQFITSPKFPMRPLPERQEPERGQSEEYRFLNEFLAQEDKTLARTRINSGIQLVGRDFLHGDFAEELKAMAELEDFPNEQAVLTAYFRRHDGKGHAFKSPAYNFKAPSLAILSPREAEALLPRVANLHFLGSRKPWQSNNSRRLGLPATLWWRQAAALAPHADFFGARGLAERAAAMLTPAASHAGEIEGIIPAPALRPD